MKAPFVSKTFLKFLLVGIVNTVVGLSITFTLFHLFDASYYASTLAGTIIGAVVSYFLNRTFTFQSQKNITGSMIRFAAVILGCYFFSYTISIPIIRLFVNLFPIFASFGNDITILAGAGIYTITNYLGQKFLVF